MIRILEKNVADKIAAGEVVDRPVSIVKELIENSIDAGAGSIIVEIRKGGKSYIRVTDDGSGIYSGEAELAFMNSIKDRYILLRRLREELTVEPYFIDDFEDTYVNIETIGYFSEVSVEIYSEKEYDELLTAAVRKTCGGCSCGYHFPVLI